MRVAGFISAMCVLLSLPAGAMTLEEQLQFADGLYARGIHDMAAQEYTVILEKHPQGTHIDRVLFRRAECYRQSGQRVAADKDLRRIYMEFPQSEFRFRAGFRRADLYREAGQAAAAADLYAAVLKDNPPADIASACLYFTAETQISREQFAEAVATLEGLRRTYPASPFESYALLKLGELYASRFDEPAKAVVLYETAAANPATDRLGAEALFLLANLHFSQGNYEKSAEHFGALLNRYPGDARADESRMKAGWAAYYAARYAEALTHIQNVMEKEETARRDEWLYLRANCERQLLRNDAAAETYRTLIETAPDSKYAHAARYEQALVFYKMGRFEDAVAMAEKVDISGKLERDVYWLLAESHAALNHEDKAIQYYRLVTTKFPDSALAADSSYRLAHLLQSRGEFQEAAHYFGKTAQDFPDSEVAPRALFASAICLQKLNRYDEAARDWAKMATTYADHPLAEEALYQKGMSEMRLERFPDATTSFRALLERYPQSEFRADALFWRGTLLSRAEQYEDAEAEFRLSLQASPRRELEREVQFGLGTALYNRKQFSEAAALFSALLNTPVRDRLSPPLLRWLAEYRLQEGQYDQAEQAAKLLVDRNVSEVWTQSGWALLGRCAAGRGDKAAAKAAFARANELAVNGPFAAESALKLGELVFEMEKDRVADALLYFQRAAALAGAESQLAVRARAYAGMGEASDALGDKAAAARYYMSVAILYDDAELVPRCLSRAADAFAASAQTNAAQRAQSELLSRYPQSKWAKQVAEAGHESEDHP